MAIQSCKGSGLGVRLSSITLLSFWHTQHKLCLLHALSTHLVSNINKADYYAGNRPVFGQVPQSYVQDTEEDSFFYHVVNSPL
jgi:hypothetical protein